MGRLGQGSNQEPHGGAYAVLDITFGAWIAVSKGKRKGGLCIRLTYRLNGCPIIEQSLEDVKKARGQTVYFAEADANGVIYTGWYSLIAARLSVRLESRKSGKGTQNGADGSAVRADQFKRQGEQFVHARRHVPQQKRFQNGDVLLPQRMMNR